MSSQKESTTKSSVGPDFRSLDEEALAALIATIDAGVAREMTGLCVMCRVKFEVSERKFAADRELLELQLQVARAKRAIEEVELRIRLIDEEISKTASESQ